jgi:phosphotransferase system enzyme I (PtsI)
VSARLEARGVGAAPGIAVAPAYVLRRERLVVPEYAVAPEDVEAEVVRLHRAFERARGRLAAIRDGMKGMGLVADVFDAQFLFLEDPTLREHAERGIREEGRNAEWALERELRRLEAVFESISDPYIRERSSDVSFVVRRVLQALMGREPEGIRNAPPGVIVVAGELSPADVAQMERGRVSGIVTEGGSKTSHVAIMARSLELPCVVGAGPVSRELEDGTPLIIDGTSGRVLVDPDQASLREYETRRRHSSELARRLLRFASLPAETCDGIRIGMLANVDQKEEVADALRYGAEGIGLFRTEYLFMNRSDLPSEEEQVEEYRKILESIAPRGAVIRTLDLGGEKVPTGVVMASEPNPALGLRGVRLSVVRPELFRVQLRALLRASAFGQPKVLIPMVSSLAEVSFAVRELRDVRAQLEAEGHKLADRVELGIMIETPAAAMVTDLIAPNVDFLSIGTNDLLQYTLAVDRENEHVAYLYEPLHPAILRMIQRVTQAGRRAGIVVSMCGEMAGDPLHAWVLLALGVGELSMAPSSIPLIKKIVRESSGHEARELLHEVLALESPAAVRRTVLRAMRRRFPAEFEALLEG